MGVTKKNHIKKRGDFPEKSQEKACRKWNNTPHKKAWQNTPHKKAWQNIMFTPRNVEKLHKCSHTQK